jgi:hypothetical protein
VTHIAWTEINTRFYCGILKEGKNMEDLGIDRMIILKWTVRKLDVRA